MFWMFFFPFRKTYHITGKSNWQWSHERALSFGTCAFGDDGSCLHMELGCWLSGCWFPFGAFKHQLVGAFIYLSLSKPSWERPLPSWWNIFLEGLETPASQLKLVKIVAFPICHVRCFLKRAKTWQLPFERSMEEHQIWRGTRWSTQTGMSVMQDVVCKKSKKKQATNLPTPSNMCFFGSFLAMNKPQAKAPVVRGAGTWFFARRLAFSFLGSNAFWYRTQDLYFFSRRLRSFSRPMHWRSLGRILCIREDWASASAKVGSVTWYDQWLCLEAYSHTSFLWLSPSLKILIS